MTIVIIVAIVRDVRSIGVRAAARMAALSVAALALSACSLLEEPFWKGKPETQAPPVEVEPIGLLPVPTHHFTVDPAHDDVVGVI